MTGQDEPVYLGDALWARFDGVYIALTANKGTDDEATVYVDDGVWGALQRYAHRAGFRADNE